MKSDWMRTRQTRYTAYATVYILIVIAVLVLANYLSNQYNKSFDSTANKQFSLSDQTFKVIRNLKQDVNLTYFDRQSNFSGAGGAKDLLDRYAAVSNKVHVNYIDPVKKPEIARQAGVRTAGTIVVETAGRKQEAKGLTEEDVTGALIRAVKGNERNVCVVQGSGEHSLDETGASGISVVKQLLEGNNYKTQALNLLRKPEIGKECTVLLVAGPKLDYVEPVVTAIKTYIEGGGRALFTLDPPLQLKGDQVGENQLLADQLGAWGVNPQKDHLFPLEERLQMVSALTKRMKNVTVESYAGLTVQFVRRRKAITILRGLRNLTDLDYEFRVALTNRRVAQVETVFIMTREEFGFTSSSLIKQIVMMGGDPKQLEGLLPKPAIERLVYYRDKQIGPFAQKPREETA